MPRAILLLLVSFSFVSTCAAENWPVWRGPTYNGVSKEKNIPTEWTTAKENIAWRLELPGASGATPVVWDDLEQETKVRTFDAQIIIADLVNEGFLIKCKHAGRMAYRLASIEGDTAP